MLNAQKEITELYSELSYDELKGVLENWLNPGSSTTGADEVVEELEAPKATPTQPSADMGGTQEFGDLPWETPAPKAEAPKAAAPKDDVASAFEDLFNN